MISHFEVTVSQLRWRANDLLGRSNIGDVNRCWNIASGVRIGSAVGVIRIGQRWISHASVRVDAVTSDRSLVLKGLRNTVDAIRINLHSEADFEGLADVQLASSVKQILCGVTFPTCVGSRKNGCSARNGQASRHDSHKRVAEFGRDVVCQRQIGHVDGTVVLDHEREGDVEVLWVESVWNTNAGCFSQTKIWDQQWCWIIGRATIARSVWIVTVWIGSAIGIIIRTQRCHSVAAKNRIAVLINRIATNGDLVVQLTRSTWCIWIDFGGELNGEGITDGQQR